MKKVTLFGGSFNPIHLGHLALAKAVIDQQLADEVWCMVSPQNPLKRQNHLLPETLRHQLVSKALKDQEHIKASNFEFTLPRPSYTWQTLEALEVAHPQHQFSLLIGGDNWATFQQWAKWEWILERYSIIIYPRPSYELKPPFPPRVRLLEAPLFEVSSTNIREAIATGAPVDHWLPASIVEDCKKLYAAHL